MRGAFKYPGVSTIVFVGVLAFSLLFISQTLTQSVTFAAADKPIKLTLVSQWPKGHTFGKIVIEHYIELVEKKSQNKIKIKYEDAGRLVKFKEMLPACKAGIADIFFQISSFCSGDIPLLSIWLMPFLSTSIEDHVSLCWNLATKQPDTVKALEKWKARPLYIGPIDPTCIHTVKKTIKVLEDFKGLRIRTSGGILDKAMLAVGATPTPIPSAETYVALQRGVVDGVAMHMSSMWGWKWYEQLKHSYTMTPSFLYMPAAVSINTDKWKKLPKWAKKLLLDCGQEHMAWASKALQNVYLGVQKKLKAYGNTVEEIDPKQVKRFMALCPTHSERMD